MYVNGVHGEIVCGRSETITGEFREFYARFVLKNGGKTSGARREGPHDHTLSRNLDNSNVTDNNYEVQLFPFISILRLTT